MTDHQSALVGDKHVPHSEYASLEGVNQDRCASLEGDDQDRCPAFCGGRYRFVGVMTKTRFRAHDQERACTVTEVFVDLVYIFCLQAMLQNHIDSQTSLWHFIVTYAAMFNSWLGNAFYNTRFDQDDFISHGLVLLSMVSVIGMASGVPLVWGGDNANTMSDGLTRFSFFYVCIRGILVVNYSRAWHRLPVVRTLVARLMAGFTLGCAFWLCVSFASSDQSVRNVFIGLGFLFDYGTPFTLLPMMVKVHPEHMAERFFAITQMAFAGCIFMFVGNVMNDVGASVWEVLRVGLLGLCVVYPFQLLHARDNGPSIASYEESLLSRLRCYCWLYLHMPLTMAIMLLGDAMANGINIKTLEFDIGHEDWYRTMLFVSTSIFHLLLVCIHSLSSPGISHANKIKRCIMRFVCGIILLVGPFTEWEPVGVLVLISAIGILEVIFDALRIDL